MNRQHLFFCGIKHSGKSTLGRLAAQQLGYEWIDLDDLVLDRISPYPTIRAFYQAEGKQAFMDAEVLALSSFLQLHDDSAFVISLGGGASDNDALISLIKEFGKIIYLEVPEAVLLQRILKTGIPPFLDAKDPKGSFEHLYAQRHERYSKICDKMIQLPNYPDVRDTASFLVEMLEREV